jgi:hypothetical protein
LSDLSINHTSDNQYLTSKKSNSGAHSLKNVKFTKDLGVYFDSYGSHKSHYNYLVKKINLKMGLLKRCVNYRKPEFIKMFNIFISPSLLYCSNVWSHVKKSNITCLEKPLRKFTKCLSGFKHLSYQHRLKQLNILTLSNQRLSCSTRLRTQKSRVSHRKNLVFNSEVQTFVVATPS